MKYGAILCDPPWQFQTYSDKGRDRCPDGRKGGLSNDPANHYETMTLEDISKIKVRDMAAKDCVLFLWAVDSLLPQAFAMAEGWGFKFKTVAFYWAKLRRIESTRGREQSDPYNAMFPMGTGYWTRANPEQCLLFTTGKPKRISAGVRKLIVSPRREHSRKPDETYSRIERLVKGPYLEMFARQQWPGWDSWGNETDKFTATPKALTMPAVSGTLADTDLQEPGA